MAYPAKTSQAGILTAALEEVEQGGLEHVAIRSVAAKLGLAPNALYRYFGSLAELQAALAEEARRQVLCAMEQAAGRKEPADAIQAISETYLRFARERPRVYALYMHTSGSGVKTPQCARNTEFFLEHVARVYSTEAVLEASHALWAFLHGLAVLHEAGVLSVEQSRSSLAFGLRTWLAGASEPSSG